MSEEILEKKALINGEWIESESGERFEVHYPGDGRVVGTVLKCNRKDVQNAVAAAKEGTEMTQTLQTQYMMAGMNRQDMSNRQDDDSSANAGDGAQDGGDDADAGDTVASLVESQLGVTMEA